MSFQLKMLGGAVLLGGDGPVTGRATQRRRIALLALLGVAGSKGVSRDRLMALLWPESDAERGRHLLSDSAYRVNQALGGEAILAIGDAMALNPDRVTTDVAEFETAYEASDWEAAVSRYGGPLLDGFHIGDSAEFERWVDAERERIAARYARALEQLADERERRGDGLGMAEAARMLVGHDPLSARFAVRYMRALDAVGERSAAIRHARVHAALVEQELGVEPDPQVSSFAERLATAAPAPAAQSVSAPIAKAPAATQEPSNASRSAPEPASDGDTIVRHPAAPADRSTPRDAPPQRVRSMPTGGRIAVVGAIVVILAIVGLALVKMRAAADAKLPRTIAVLPFADLSPGGGHAYLSDGITEELIATLSRAPGLRVAARTSSFAFKDNPTDVREIGEKLGVETVLEGSVRTSGDALRITAQLVDVEDGYPFWSQTYERRLDDAFAIQDEIARQIMTRLGGESSGAAVSTATQPAKVDPDAYDLYLKGRFAWHQRTQAGLLESARLLEEAVRRAPSYARAHAGLAEAYAVLAFYDYLPPAEAFPRAAEEARRALSLDTGLASPHATLGYVALYHDWDFSESERAFRRAIAADSSYSTAHQWYANLLTAMGRFPEAERAMRRAMELDPLSLIANAALGWVHYYAGEPRRALAQLDRTLELDSTFLLAWLWKGQSYELLQLHDSARTMLEHAVRQSGRSSLTLAALAHARASAGDTTKARQLLTEIERRANEGYVPAFEIARVYAALNEREPALQWLERAAAERAHSIAFLTVDPALEVLRGDARFEALVRLRRGG